MQSSQRVIAAAVLQAGRAELVKRLKHKLSTWGSLLQRFLRSEDDQVPPHQAIIRRPSSESCARAWAPPTLQRLGCRCVGNFDSESIYHGA